LTEGFHYFKVQGVVNPDGIPETELCVVKEEIYVVYVLPTLNNGYWCSAEWNYRIPVL